MNMNEFINNLDLYLIDPNSIANEQLKITPELFQTLWYEDIDGNRITPQTNANGDEEVMDFNPKAEFQISRFPLEVRETHLRIIHQEDVDKCNHPAEHVVPTGGWVDGVEGRECKLCHGTQSKNEWEPWPEKWNAYGSRVAFEFTDHLGKSSEKLILAMANSGEFSLSESILIVAQACERCLNVLLYTYLNGEEGYAEYSDEWKKCGTHCKMCEHELLKSDVPDHENEQPLPQDNDTETN